MKERTKEPFSFFAWMGEPSAGVGRFGPGVFAMLMLVAAQSRAACAPDDPQLVSDTLSAMFAAAEADDTARLNAIFAPGFYALDSGKRLDEASLEASVRQARARGQVYHWSVAHRDIHVACDTAWVAYVNQGSVTTEGKLTPVTWLESADLSVANGKWRVDFLESTRQAER